MVGESAVFSPSHLDDGSAGQHGHGGLFAGVVSARGRAHVDGRSVRDGGRGDPPAPIWVCGQDAGDRFLRRAHGSICGGGRTGGQPLDGGVAPTLAGRDRLSFCAVQPSESCRNGGSQPPPGAADGRGAHLLRSAGFGGGAPARGAVEQRLWRGVGRCGDPLGRVSAAAKAGKLDASPVGCVSFGVIGARPARSRRAGGTMGRKAAALGQEPGGAGAGDCAG